MVVFTADAELFKKFKKVKRELIIMTIYRGFVMVFGSVIMYGTTSQYLIPFILIELFFVLFFTWITRANVIPLSRWLNKTCIEVHIESSAVFVKTAPVKLWWVDKPGKELRYDYNQVFYGKKDYALKSIYNSDRLVWKLKSKEDECFILGSFFPDDLSTELTMITDQFYQN